MGDPGANSSLGENSKLDELQGQTKPTEMQTHAWALLSLMSGACPLTAVREGRKIQSGNYSD